MLRKAMRSKKVVYVLMTLLVFLWGLEYIAAKSALDAVRPLSLICFKYIIGVALLLAVKSVVDRRFPLKTRDLPLLCACTLFGDVMYFGAEYMAMAYLPVSIITIILAFVPCASVVTEWVVYKNKPAWPVVAGVLVSIVGVSMVIGADLEEIFQGRYAGYLLAFGAALSWNLYNFLTKDLSEKYNPLDLTLLQQVCAVAMVLPYTLANLPDAEVMNASVAAGVVYLGVISAFVGFLIYINAIDVIGPTPCALFSNFLPITSTFFGWLLLREYVSGTQLLGGAIVILSGAVVIWRKSKEDARNTR